MRWEVAEPGLVCVSASHVVQGGGRSAFKARLAWGCVFPSSSGMETHNPNQAAMRSDALLAVWCGDREGGGVFERLAWGCMFPPGEDFECRMMAG